MRDLTNQTDLSDAFHKIDRALLANDDAALAAWAREFGRPACEAIRDYHAKASDGDWGDYD